MPPATPEDDSTRIEDFIRPEARPLRWEDLTHGQREAARFVLDRLREAVDGLPEPERPTARKNAADSYLDRNRASRLAFLDGGRGTGKTTAMLTLVDAIKQADMGSIRHADMRSAQGTCDSLRGRLVWLPVLDMEPFWGPGNLLASILVRIERAVEGLTASHTGAAAWGSSTGDELDEVFVELGQLQTDVALAWPAVRHTIAAGTADTYVADLMRAEKACLELNPRVDQVLGALAWHIQAVGEKRNPLFVLPVDDIDLCPNKSTELLRVLRMVSSPRLFALVVGRYDDLEPLFRAETLGRLHQASQGAKLELQERERLTAIAGATAVHGVRKLIPPAQVATIRPPVLDKSTAKEITNLRLRDKGESLGERLESVPLPSRPRPDIGNLKDFLLASAAGKAEENSQDDDFVYRGAGVLEASIRQLTDLHLQLGRAKAKAEGEGDPLNYFAAEIAVPAFRAALAETYPPGPVARDAASRAVHITRDGGVLISAGVLEDLPLAHRRLTTRLAMPPVTVTAAVEPARGRRARLVAADRTPGRDNELSERASAWWFLLNDLVALTDRGGLVGDVTPLATHGDWMVVDWGGSSSSRVSLPLPRWSTSWYEDQFMALWRSVCRETVKDSTDGADRVSGIRARWMNAIVAVTRQALPSNSSSRPGQEVIGVAAIIREAMALWKGATDEERKNPSGTLATVIRFAVDAVVLALAPEAAATFEEAQTLLDDADVAHYFRDRAAILRAHRAKQHQAAVEAVGSDDVDSLCGLLLIAQQLGERIDGLLNCIRGKPHHVNNMGYGNPMQPTRARCIADELERVARLSADSSMGKLAPSLLAMVSTLGGRITSLYDPNQERIDEQITQELEEMTSILKKLDGRAKNPPTQNGAFEQLTLAPDTRDIKLATGFRDEVLRLLRSPVAWLVFHPMNRAERGAACPHDGIRTLWSTIGRDIVISKGATASAADRHEVESSPSGS